MADRTDDSARTPDDDDIRFDDAEFNPALEPKSAKAWLNLLAESEDAFEDWNLHCDRIDEQYASLSRLAQLNRDKEFQMFWANAEVLKPSIYAKPPVPVVVTKFKDRRPVYQAASELAERCATVAFDLTGINELMLLVRDDLSMASRGVAWCRYESGKSGYYNHEKVCIDFKPRRDFLHAIARNWREVGWVAGASWMTRAEARKRFHAYSGDEYQRAEYRVDKDTQEIGGTDARERAQVWEVWDRNSQRVVWVAKGCEHLLDEDDPHLELRNFFPCPKPVYGTVQRGALVPVPDVLQYRDQLEEINMLTARIHALSDAVQVKGFYPAGSNEGAEAIQTALAINTPGQVMVPISNWAAFGASKEIIIWMPIDMIATTIQGLVALRKQVIEDIYQITGLADIMRGDTDPNETLGAQQLKTQYGSTRIRDKQQELVRFARDLVEITLEIITEKFAPETMIEMSQTQLPTNAMIEQQAEQLQQQIAQQYAQMMQTMQQQPPPQADAGGSPGAPDPAQQATQQAQQQLQGSVQQLQQLQQQPTVEQVLQFLKDNRARSFVLDIETDSTILADENGEKQRRSEFVGMLGTLLPQLATMVQTDPNTAEFCSKILKFSVAPYRAGRELDGSIDKLAEMAEQKASQPQAEDPATMNARTLLQIEQLKDATNRQKIMMEAQLNSAKLQQADQHKNLELSNQRTIKQMELASKQGTAQADIAVQAQKVQENRESHQAHMMENQQKMALERQKADLAIQSHQLKANDMAQRQRAAQTKLQQGGGLV